jgi:hypothetical protein
VHEIHALAVALLEHGATEEALRLGEHGLRLPEPTDRMNRVSRVTYDGGTGQWVVRANRATLAAWVRDAAAAAGRAGEWRAYMDEVIEKHRRKYSLAPLLKQVLGEPPEQRRRR